VAPGQKYLLSIPGKRASGLAPLGVVLAVSKDRADTYRDRRGTIRKGVRVAVIAGPNSDPEFIKMPPLGPSPNGQILALGEEMIVPARYISAPFTETNGFDPQQREMVRRDHYQRSRDQALSLLARAREYGVDVDFKDEPWEYFAEGPDPMMLLEFEDLDLERVLDLLDHQRGLYLRELELRREAMKQR
jgi:hypothetical protein